MQTPQTWRGRGRVAGGVAALAATVLMLGGCVGAPSSAAEVGGTVVPEDLVETTTQGAAQALGATPEELRKPVLSTLIGGVVVEQMAAQSAAAGGPSLDVTPADREAVIQSQPQVQQMLTVPDAVPLADALIERLVAQQRLGPEAFQEGYLAVPVEVNPRWGTWDPTSPEGLTGTGSLSVESYSG